MSIFIKHNFPLLILSKTRYHLLTGNIKVLKVVHRPMKSEKSQYRKNCEISIFSSHRGRKKHIIDVSNNTTCTMPLCIDIQITWKFLQSTWQ